MSYFKTSLKFLVDVHNISVDSPNRVLINTNVLLSSSDFSDSQVLIMLFHIFLQTPTSIFDQLVLSFENERLDFSITHHFSSTNLIFSLPLDCVYIKTDANLSIGSIIGLLECDNTLILNGYTSRYGMDHRKCETYLILWICWNCSTC